MPKFHEFIGALLALVAVGAVVYAAIYQNNGEAQGALVAIVVAANSYFLRAKLQPPNGSGSTVPTTTVSVPMMSTRPSPTMTITSTTTATPTESAPAPTVPSPAIPDPTAPVAP